MKDSKKNNCSNCSNCASKDKRCMPANGESCGNWKKPQLILGGNHCFSCLKSYMPNIKVCPDCGKTLVPQR